MKEMFWVEEVRDIGRHIDVRVGTSSALLSRTLSVEAERLRSSETTSASVKI